MPDRPDPGDGYWIDENGEHRWIKLTPGRLDVGIIAETGDPHAIAADLIHALGDDPGEVHLDVTVAQPDLREGYSQPGCAAGTWLTGTIIGRIADGFGLPPSLFATEPINHWAQPDPTLLDQYLDQVTVSYERRLDP